MRSSRPLSTFLTTGLLLGLAAFASGEPNTDTKSVFKHFVTRQGDKLLDRPNELRFVSFNIPNLHYVEDAVRFDQTNPWRLPDNFEIVDSLKSIRQAGGLVARTYTLSVRRPGQSDDIPVHVLAPGKFNEEAFRALDRVLAQANQLGIRVIIPLVDQHQWWGGRGEYAAMRGKPKDAFWTDRQVIADFKKTIDYVLNRKNTVTGVQYKDDKAILAWETGNELEPPPAWTREIAAYLKQVDPNHLVIDGRNAAKLGQESIDDPNVDVVTTHHYATDVQETLRGIRQSQAMAKGKKPYFVGEFGFLDTPDLEAILDTVIKSGTSGALIWSLRCHNTDGGFYCHSEPMVDGRYKAYHWPGFPSGNGYDEIGVLDLMRRKAFEIRGLPLPPIERPEPPTLLPIQNAAAISWQGSAGATSYDVERATTPDGPWMTVGRDVTDAALAYRPLFHDATAQIGKQYYYRVKAKNVAGTSPASNVVGPVTIDTLWLVDEMENTSRLHARQGEAKLVSKTSRQAKEDANRLAGKSGDAIIYRSEQPMTAATVYAFFPNQISPLRFSVSSDGNDYAEVRPESLNHFSGQGAYGYFKPVEYRLQRLPRDSRYLKIEFTAPSEIARVEIQFGAQGPKSQ